MINTLETDLNFRKYASSKNEEHTCALSDISITVVMISTNETIYKA